MRIVKNKENKNIFLNFKDVCTVQQGLQINISERLSEKLENTYPYITIQNIKNNNFNDFILNPRKSVICNLNEILIARTGSVGKVVMGVEGVFHNNFFKLNLFENYNNKFIYYVLNSKKSQKNMKRLAGVTTIPDLKHSDFFKLKVISVNIEQQNKIAQLLSEKEQHIENIKTLISKLEKRNEYYAEKLLSGELRVRENEKGEIEFYENTEWKEVKINGRISKMPKDWQINKINEIFNIERGIVLSKEHILKNKGEYPVYSSATLNKGCIGYINTYTHESECLTWTTDGNYAGTVFYRNEKFTPTNICGVLNLKNLNINFNVYYLYLIAKKEFPKMVNKVGNNKLMSNVVEKIELKYPNYIEQDKISYIIDIYEKEKELLENLLKKETKEFEWLSEKLLSGEYIIED